MEGQWIWEECGGSEFDQSTIYEILKEVIQILICKKNTYFYL